MLSREDIIHSIFINQSNKQREREREREMVDGIVGWKTKFRNVMT